MGAAVLDRPPTLFDGARDVDALGGGVTLEAAILGVWEDLTAHRPVVCPVCGGRMAPRYGAAGRPAGGRCADCGGTLG